MMNVLQIHWAWPLFIVQYARQFNNLKTKNQILTLFNTMDWLVTRFISKRLIKICNQIGYLNMYLDIIHVFILWPHFSLFSFSRHLHIYLMLKWIFIQSIPNVKRSSLNQFHFIIFMVCVCVCAYFHWAFQKREREREWFVQILTQS